MKVRNNNSCYETNPSISACLKPLLASSFVEVKGKLAVEDKPPPVGTAL